jgi:hypothetical protein
MNARFDSKPLAIAASVRARNIDDLGYVTRAGLSRMKRGNGKVEVFFPERQARGYTFMSRRIYMADFLTLVETIQQPLGIG